MRSYNKVSDGNCFIDRPRFSCLRVEFRRWKRSPGSCSLLPCLCSMVSVPFPDISHRWPPATDIPRKAHGFSEPAVSKQAVCAPPLCLCRPGRPGGGGDEEPQRKRPSSRASVQLGARAGPGQMASSTDPGTQPFARLLIWAARGTLKIAPSVAVLSHVPCSS